MTLLYDRRISVTASPKEGDQGLDFKDFRVRFSVIQKTIQTPNTADVRIYNLSDKTKNVLKQGGEFSRLRVSAGYPGAFGLIFDGTIVQVKSGRETPTDTFLDLIAADGDIAYNFATVNTSLAAGASAKDVLAALAKSMEPHGVTMGYAPDDLKANTSPRGRALFGMTRDHLRTLAQDNDCEWSIQNGKLTLVKNGKSLPDPALVLSSETGMIGLPQQTQLGIAVRVLINPAMRVGARVHINNKSVQKMRIDTSYAGQVQNSLLPRVAEDGFYRILVVDHFGDTRGQEWYSQAICVALGDPITAGLVQRGVNEAT